MTLAPTPGRALGVVGLVLAVVVAPAGLAVSIVAQVRASRAQMHDIPAIVGIVIGSFLTLAAPIVALLGVLIWAVAGIECGETAGRSGCL